MHEVVRMVGNSMALCKENNHYFLIRCREERSQNFGTEKEAWTALRNRKVHWEKFV